MIFKVKSTTMDDPPESASSSERENLLKSRSRYGYSNKSDFAQILATLIQGWILINHGLFMAAPTLILGALYEHPEDELYMDDDEASWFGSIPYICTPLVDVASGFLQEVLGRRGSGLLSTIPMFSTWVLLYSANSVTALYAVAAVMGLSVGLSEAPLNSYLGEIGEPHLRGILVTIASSAISVGIIMLYALGSFYDWRTTALITSVVPIITFLLMTQIPESPAWLIGRNRMEDAKKSLCWLRGRASADEVEEEFKELVSYTKTHTRDGKGAGAKAAEIDGVLKTQVNALMTKEVLRPLRLVLITFAITFLAAVSGMRPYSINELNSMDSPIDPKLILMFAQVLFIYGAVVNIAFLRRLGKRKIALFSYGFAALCILGIGAYCSNYRDISSYRNSVWLPPIFLLVINFLSGMSILVLPWQLMSEVFPPAGRGLATGISAAWTHVVVSALIKSYLYIKSWVGMDGVMYLYGGATALGCLYFYFHLPETEGKTLEQIESCFIDHPDPEEVLSVGSSPARDPEKARLRKNRKEPGYGSTTRSEL